MIYRFAGALVLLVVSVIYSGATLAEIDDGVYVYEYAPKIDYHIMIGFIEIKDTKIVIDESYKIVLDVSKTGITVKKVKKAIEKRNLSLEPRENGNVYVHGIKRLAYSKENYAKWIPENRKKYYRAINAEFFSLENAQKREIIRRLQEKWSKL